jgi:hypothetical protein
MDTRQWDNGRLSSLSRIGSWKEFFLFLSSESFVFQSLDKLIDQDGKDRASNWPNPVYPVVGSERLGYYAWRQRPSWV